MTTVIHILCGTTLDWDVIRIYQLVRARTRQRFSYGVQNFPQVYKIFPGIGMFGNFDHVKKKDLIFLPNIVKMLGDFNPLTLYNSRIYMV